ncbi:ceramide kinase-like protein, partial [Exaiptasia diaphana]|uniref:DAGKc domain-containing protein n=1 Tax=Exaiptasia diaphana TaxID=2652724 RepID=A0A913YAS3_EXADI
MYNLQARSLLMRDVIGALIRKKKSSKKSNSPGKLLGLTVCTYCKEGDRKLAESRLSFESDDLELCQLWSSTINENLKGLHGRPSKLKVFINPHSKKGKAPMVYDSLVAPLFRKAGIKTDVISLHGRPSKLKVFINPHSKKGKAPMVYDSLVAPLFRKAGIKTDVI